MMVSKIIESSTCHVFDVVSEPLVAVDIHHRDEFKKGNQGKTSGAKAGEVFVQQSQHLHERVAVDIWDGPPKLKVK